MMSINYFIQSSRPPPGWHRLVVDSSGGSLVADTMTAAKDMLGIPSVLDFQELVVGFLVPESGLPLALSQRVFRLAVVGALAERIHGRAELLVDEPPLGLGVEAVGEVDRGPGRDVHLRLPELFGNRSA